MRSPRSKQIFSWCSSQWQSHFFNLILRNWIPLFAFMKHMRDSHVGPNRFYVEDYYSFIAATGRLLRQMFYLIWRSNINLKNILYISQVSDIFSFSHARSKSHKHQTYKLHRQTTMKSVILFLAFQIYRHKKFPFPLALEKLNLMSIKSTNNKYKISIYIFNTVPVTKIYYLFKQKEITNRLKVS